MKKLALFGSLMWLWGMILSGGQAQANGSFRVVVAAPPAIVVAGPPDLIVIPGTYVYVAPDLDADLYFWDGWWWRFYEGRWFRSSYYDRDWVYYRSVPVFYRQIPSGWRAEFRGHSWQGRYWNYKRVPYSSVQQNWGNWKRDRYWERQGGWGMEDRGDQGEQGKNRGRGRGHSRGGR